MQIGDSQESLCMYVCVVFIEKQHAIQVLGMHISFM